VIRLVERDSLVSSVRSRLLPPRRGAEDQV